MFSFSQLPDLIEGHILQMANDECIEYLLIDSRKLLPSPRSLFFAIKGVRNDGHAHIGEAYREGIRMFVVEQDLETNQYPLACFVKVGSSIKALQELASAHRSQFDCPVIGITGSNGKTIVKEWLYQMLSSKFNCVKNPGSYNSQVGVPLSVWQMGARHELGMFEAGISLPGEMEALRKIIQPTMGIFTMLGPAHDEGFASPREKLLEKLQLFQSCKTIIYCQDHVAVRDELARQKKPFQELVSWGEKEGADILLEFKNDGQTTFSGKFGQFQLTLPFTNPAGREDLLHCIATLLCLGLSAAEIQERISLVRTVPMRLELKQGINQCQVIDDTYNNDLGGLRISLDFLEGVNMPNKTLVLSDVLQSGLTLDELCQQVLHLLLEKKIRKFVGIGFGFHSHQNLFAGQPVDCRFYLTTEDFLKEADWGSFEDEAILVKGARVFQFEKITKVLQKKIHGTTMEIDMGAMVHNLNFFRSLLQPGVKLMVMIKAFAYGSGSNEIASLLQYHQVDYLGVAYADEGAELRDHNIRLPIMVMNPGTDGWDVLLARQLEPEVYSLSLLHSLVAHLNGKPCAIHLKIDTGMHRLGFALGELPEVARVLSMNENVKVVSVFSHLAGADDPAHDAFSEEQAGLFNKALDILQKALKTTPIRHLLNTSGALRLPAYQYDMVRLGIGLYGIDPTGKFRDKLKPVATLKTVVSQVRRVARDGSVGYGRMGKAKAGMALATIAIGYADGYSRSFGNGVGQVGIRGKKAPVVGNVCMDMTMVDVSHIPEVAEGDEVVIFGEANPIYEMAAQAGTIPYEILTNTSERVKRVFFAESI